MSHSRPAEPLVRPETFPAEPLRSPFRSREQMEWIHGRFTVDGLARLACSTPDYYEQKGGYLPDVAALAHAALSALDRIRAAVGDAYVQIAHGDATMIREHWEAIEAALLAAGCEEPVAEIVIAKRTRG